MTVISRNKHGRTNKKSTHKQSNDTCRWRLACNTFLGLGVIALLGMSVSMANTTVAKAYQIQALQEEFNDFSGQGELTLEDLLRYSRDRGMVESAASLTITTVDTDSSVALNN